MDALESVVYRQSNPFNTLYLTMFSSTMASGDAEVYFQNNSIVAILLLVVICSSYSVTLPSMYQFVTSPSTPPKEAENDTFWPGLGESDYMYSYVVAVYSIGELVGTLGSIYVTMMLPFCYSIPLACLMVSGGGVLYGLSTNVWMILTARILYGASAGLGIVLIYTYIGGASNQSMECTKKRLCTKDRLYLICSMTYNLAFMSCLGVVALVTHIMDVDPYRWGGWYVLSVSLLYLVLFLIFYKEIHSYKPKLPHNLLPSSAFAFILYYSYTKNTVNALLDTISTPVLSHQFGIGLESAPYFMLGITAYLTLVVSVLSILKKLGIDNRVGLALGLVLALSGTLLVGDWQGIGGNPCAMNTTYESSIEPGMSGALVDDAKPGPLPEIYSASGCCDYQLTSGSLLTETLAGDNNASRSRNKELCESQSTSEHQCFWNPESRVTGHHCSACKPVCLSTQRSLNFVQFTIGVALSTSLIPIGTYFGVVIASNIAGKRLQGTVQSFVYLSGVMARFSTPLWMVAIYEKSGEHTYAPASVLAMNMLIVLLLIPVLYKRLAHRSMSRIPLYKASIYPTPAIHKVDQQRESLGILSLDSIHKWVDTVGLSTTSFTETPTLDTFNQDKDYDTLLRSSHEPVTFTVGEHTSRVV